MSEAREDLAALEKVRYYLSLTFIAFADPLSATGLRGGRSRDQRR